LIFHWSFDSISETVYETKTVSETVWKIGLFDLPLVFRFHFWKSVQNAEREKGMCAPSRQEIASCIKWKRKKDKETSSMMKKDTILLLCAWWKDQTLGFCPWIHDVLFIPSRIGWKAHALLKGLHADLKKKAFAFRPWMDDTDTLGLWVFTLGNTMAFLIPSRIGWECVLPHNGFMLIWKKGFLWGQPDLDNGIKADLHWWKQQICWLIVSGEEEMAEIIASGATHQVSWKWSPTQLKGWPRSSATSW